MELLGLPLHPQLLHSFSIRDINVDISNKGRKCWLDVAPVSCCNFTVGFGENMSKYLMQGTFCDFQIGEMLVFFSPL